MWIERYISDIFYSSILVFFSPTSCLFSGGPTKKGRSFLTRKEGFPHPWLLAHDCHIGMGRMSSSHLLKGWTIYMRESALRLFRGLWDAFPLAHWNTDHDFQLRGCLEKLVLKTFKACLQTYLPIDRNYLLITCHVSRPGQTLLR